MNMLISLVALTTLVSDLSRQPSWQTDYQAALAQSAMQNKPLAVFLAPASAAWDKLSREGKLNKDIQQLLAAKYVPVYLNTDTVQGKELASTFELTGGVGLVLSDREGLHQSYWHEGALADGDLAQALQRHADPTGPVLTTESNQVLRTSFYGPGAGVQQTYRLQPAFSTNCST